MKLHIAILLASTALMPAMAVAQAPAQPARPATAQPSTQTPAAVEFVNKAASSNLFEIQSSQLAMEKSQNNRVREFAQKMVQDHTGATERMKAVAQGMMLPTNPDQQHSQMLQQLQGASGPDFDRRYVQLQLAGHEESVRLFDQYAQGGDNPQLKQFAQQTLPTLREHLQSVQQIRTQLPPDQTAQSQPGQPVGAQSQGTADPSRVTVQQAAPTVRVDQAAPQVTVQQAQPNVTVRQAQPEILVRQPQPTVTVDIPQPEIIVRMPQPEVNVSQAQPQVQVNQAQPQVQVVQPQQQAEVKVEQSQGQQVQVLGNDAQPNVRYERAEPRVVVNQAQGQPNVRIERQGEGQQTAQGAEAPRQPMVTPPAQQDTAVRPADTTAGPRTTGALPGAQAFPVSRINDMNLYNAQGNELGDVERVVQGADGKQHIVIGAGGFLGIGEKHVAIPLDRVTVRGDRLTIQGLTDDQIRAMPSFDRNDRSFRQLEGNQAVQVTAAR